MPSTPPDTPEASPDAASERTFDTFSDYRQALLDVLTRATGTIVVFDPDLGECRFESRQALERLEGLCLRSTRPDALRLLLHDVDALERDCPRLQSLLRNYGHRASVRITDPGSRNWTQPFVVVDGEHLVTRFHPDLPRGRANFAMPSAAAAFCIQFETMWLRGESRAIGVPLGL